MNPAEELLSQLKWPTTNSNRTIALEKLVQLIDSRLVLKDYSRKSISELIERFKGSIPKELEQYGSTIVISSLDLVKNMLDQEESIRFLITQLFRLSNQNASTFIGWFGSDAHEALPLLINNVAENSYGSLASARAVIRIGPIAKPLILAELRDQFKKQDAEAFLRTGSLAIETDGYKALEFIELIRLVLQSNNSEFRAAVAELVTEIPPLDREKFTDLLTNFEKSS